jgi:very-short-patch-repair endonuclease
MRQRELRRNATEVEKRLWSRLRNRQLDGIKFRRQTPIGRYIVDFVSESEKLIVELDGGQHAQQTEADAERTQALESMGYIVIRFWNNEVIENIDGVLMEILNTARSAKPLSHGERGLGEGIKRR